MSDNRHHPTPDPWAPLRPVIHKLSEEAERAQTASQRIRLALAERPKTMEIPIVELDEVDPDYEEEI